MKFNEKNCSYCNVKENRDVPGKLPLHGWFRDGTKCEDFGFAKDNGMGECDCNSQWIKCDYCEGTGKIFQKVEDQHDKDSQDLANILEKL